MATITFDTMDYAEQLIESGVPQQQAKVQSKALKSVVDDIVSNALATKNDLIATNIEITNKIADLELKIEKRFVRLEVFMSIMIAILVIPILKDFFYKPNHSNQRHQRQMVHIQPSPWIADYWRIF